MKRSQIAVLVLGIAAVGFAGYGVFGRHPSPLAGDSARLVKDDRLDKDNGGRLEKETGGRLEKETGGRLEKETGGRLEKETGRLGAGAL